MFWSYLRDSQDRPHLQRFTRSAHGAQHEVMLMANVYYSDTARFLSQFQKGKRHRWGLEESMCRILCSLSPVTKMKQHVYNNYDAQSNLLETRSLGGLLGAGHIDFCLVTT